MEKNQVKALFGVVCKTVGAALRRAENPEGEIAGSSARTLSARDGPWSALVKVLIELPGHALGEELSQLATYLSLNLSQSDDR